MRKLNNLSTRDYQNDEIIAFVQHMGASDWLYDNTPNDGDKSIVVPANYEWDVCGIASLVATSSSAGTRSYIIQIRNELDVLVWRSINQTCTANQSVRLYMTPGTGYNERVILNGGFMDGLPRPCILKPGYSIRIYDENTVDVAGDDITIAVPIIKTEVR